MRVPRPKHLLFILAAAAFVAAEATPAWAQATGTINGAIIEAGSQRPVVSASVYIAGTALGTLSNSAGRFQIGGVPAGEVTLRVEVIGYASQERTINVQANQTVSANFELRQSTIELSQIVVTGAGAGTERRRLGNTVATIDATAMQNAPVSNISEILQGREPGVVGLTSGGMAGEGSRIRIRGSASLSQSNEPVIYLDGVRIDGSGGFGPGVGQDGGAPSRLDDINPASIERIEILKGAAAATLYGTQASNGVIQIFTKRGQTGAPRYNLQVEQGFSRYPDVFPRHAGFATTTEGSSRDRGTSGIQQRWGVSVQPYEVFEVDMIRDFLETGHSQTYSLSVDGGTSAVTYFVSGRLHTEDGPFGATDLVAPGFRPAQDVNDRKQFAANVMIFPRPDLRVRIGSNYTEAHQQVPDNNNNIFGALSSLLNSRPERAHSGNLYGSPAFATTRENMHRLTTQDVQRFGGNLSANYQPTSSLTLDATVGIDMVNQQAVRFIPFGWNVDAFTASDVAGNRTSSDRNNRELTLDVKSTWNTEFAQDFSSSFLVGAQGFITKTQAVRGTGNQFPGPGLEVAGAAALQSTVESFAEEVNAGFFAQEQVGYQNYLFATVGGRYDRHSAFGETAGGAFYPKGSLSVIPSDLPGWDNRTLSTFRLRTALGRSGLQPSAFARFTTFNPLAAETGPGVAPGNLGDPGLKPEVSLEWEVGTELGFFEDRASIDLTYWNRTVTDVLVDRQFAPGGGFRARQLDNIGEMKAWGVDVGLQAFVVNTPGVQLSLFANAAFLREEITDLGGAPALKVGGSYPRYRQFTNEGYAPGSFFGPKLQDVEYPISATGGCTPSTREELLTYFSEPRDPTNIPVLVQNCGGDELSFFLGKPVPDWQGAFGGTLNFLQNFQLGTLFEYRFGNYHIHDLTGGFRRSHALIGRNVREAAEVEAILTNPASSAEERLEAGLRWARELKALSPVDGLNEIHEADWLRLRELSLTWNAPLNVAERINAGSLSITASGRNLLLFTKYPGEDPEMNIVSRGAGDALSQNFLDGTGGWGLPLPRRFAVSLRVGF